MVSKLQDGLTADRPDTHINENLKLIRRALEHIVTAREMEVTNVT